MITDSEQRVYDFLAGLGIPYDRHEHPPVFTVEQAELHWAGISGAHCKNLFLRNKKGNHHYLVILLGSKKADLRRVEQELGEDRLSFASPERLLRCLGLEAGAVSPFGLINDPNKEVKVVDVSTTNSDGSDVTNVPLGPKFPAGLFVAMADNKTFQYYSWVDIAGGDLVLAPNGVKQAK